MSYDLVKNRIVARLQGLGYTECSQAVDWKNAAVNEYNNNFILLALSGVMDDNESETMVNKFYDVQSWQIQIAFDKSAQNDIVNRDDMHRKKDLILKDLDKPANWEGCARILKYKSWEIMNFPNYFVLTINLKIVDTYTY